MFVEKPYISTHVHTDMSNIRLPDCINKINNVIDYALTLGLRGIAITDHECLSNHVKGELYLKDLKKKAKKILEGGNNSPETIEKCKRVLDFRLLLGNEIYLVRNGLTRENRQKGEKFHHFILIAKDLEGHKQLRELSTRAWSRSYKQGIERVYNYYSDLEDIVKPNPGHLITTTACLGGFLGEHVLKFGRTGSEESEKAIDGFIRRMVGLFGDDFYLEMQPSLNSEQIFYNKSLMQLSQKYNVPLIIATDAHYLRAEDRPIHKAYLNSKQGEREVDDFYSTTYLMSSSEMWFKYMDTYIPQIVFEGALKNTLRIGEKCEEYSLFHKQIVPRIPLSSKEEWDENLEVPFGGESIRKFANSPHDQDRYLLHTVKKSMEERVPKEKIAKYWNRIEYEFDILWDLSERLGDRLSAYLNTMTKIINLIWEEGDSIVGPGRGSAAGFLSNRLIKITQVNPLEQGVEMPAWRFLNKERVELPDIDIDIEASKKEKVLNVLHKYFSSLGGDLVNVATFGTEGAKSALNTACRSLDYEPEYGLYLSSMVPSERGQTWNLHDCYYGNKEKERAPVQTFVNEMNAHPDVWKVAQGIEGLIKQRGIHPCGVIIFNGDPTEFNAIMKAPNGTRTTQFELHDSEYMGGLKYDILVTDAEDKIRTCMDLLLDYKKIEWQGSLRATYNKYLHPDVIDYKNKEMWKLAGEGKITDLFQFMTDVGSQAIQHVKPTSLLELAVSNSLMRLMSNVGGKTPMETYVLYKQDINEWLSEMERYNLTPSEQQILKDQLLKQYGVAESQESIMLLSIHPKIANFTIGEANSLRKAVAKKNPKVLEEVKSLFFQKGRAAGTSENMLRYVWEVQIGRQIGYSLKGAIA